MRATSILWLISGSKRAGSTRLVFQFFSILAAGLSFYFIDNLALQILAVSFSVIAFIILGEKSTLEDRWEGLGLPGREAIAPVIALGVFVFQGQIPQSTIVDVFVDKAPILALILSFAVVSNGLSKCGFFEYTAYKAVEKCGGETKRLILYIFIIASAITLVTSNDIVVLTLTPIIYAICVNAKIRNGKLFFLAQFVAANTLAMGLMIGSPTNIIVAQDFGLDFVEYSILMFVPAVFSFFLTIIVVDFVNRKSRPGPEGSAIFQKLGWQYNDRYRVPSRAPWSEFTRRMSRWIWLFAGAVVLLMIVTNYSSDERALYFVAFPLILGCGLLQLFEVVADETYFGKSKSKRVADFAETMFSLPYGIIFFATAFFVFSRVVVESGALTEFVESYILFAEQNPLLAGPATVFASGAAVNTVNDLPAAALISETLRCDLYPDLQNCLNSATATAPQTFTVNVIVASLLVGLNIGCYLTPVGALAGLIWFSQMRKEERRQRTFHAERVRQSRMQEMLGEFKPVTLPTRRDLVLYGALNFFFVGLMLGLFVPFSAFVLQIFVYPAADLSNVFSSIEIPGLGWTVLAGFLVVAYILLRTGKVITDNQVALSHMSEIFTLLNSLTIWSFKHRILYIVSILGSFILISGIVLFWAEGTSFALYPEFYAIQAGVDGRGVEPVNTDSVANFATWFFVFFGSSYEQLQFPQSFIGQIIAAVVPLSAIAAVLYIVRNTSNESLAKLRVALGHGEIPNYRIIIVNHQAKFEQAVMRMLDKKGSFVVLLCREEHVKRAETFADALLHEPGKANRVLVQQISLDPYGTLKELDFSSAGEIYFLTDLRLATDVDNMRMLTRIDAWLNSEKPAAAEDLAASGYDHTGADSGLQLKSLGDFVGIPKIYFEASSQRQLERITSSLSDLTRYHTNITSFDDVVVDQIMTDVFGDIRQLNTRLKFGIAMSTRELAKSMFAEGRAPFRDFRIVDRDVSTDTLSEIRSTFENHIDQESAHGRSIKGHAVDVRIHIQKILNNIRFTDGAPTSVQDSVVGIKADLDGRVLRMTAANAAVSSQAVTVSGVLQLQREVSELAPGTPPAPIDKRRQRIFLFNFNAYTDSFVRTLLRSEKLYEVDTIIMVNEWTSIPDDISNRSEVKILRRKTIDEAIGLMVPLSMNPNQATARTRPEGFEGFEGIQHGDSVIVFTDYEDETRSNVDIVQFIEGLDYRLGDGEMRGLGAQHRDLFLAVECNNEETRFLFEHLSVDKIIETSRLRRSYLEHLAETYHAFPTRMRDVEFAGVLGEARYGQYHPTIFNFRRALGYAEYFKPFVVKMADNFQILNDAGISISVIGMTCQEVHDLLEMYSEPPFFLVTVAALKPKQYAEDVEQEYGAGPYMQAAAYNPNYQISKHDCLILCPLI